MTDTLKDRPDTDDLLLQRIKALGLRHIVDIDCGTGAFVQGLRRRGYDGVAYSVAATRQQHAALAKACGRDSRWFVLRPGAAGRHNGWAPDDAPSPRSLGVEPVYAQRLDGILPPVLRRRAFAVRLTLDEHTRAVLDGLGALREHLAVLQVVVPPEAGRNTDAALAELQNQVIRQTGLRDIQVQTAPAEPGGAAITVSYTFWRPLTAAEEAPDDARPRPIIVTSIGGTSNRVGADGSNVGPTWQSQCIDSWAAMGLPIYSVSEMPSPDARIQQIAVPSRPSINEILRQAARRAPGAPILLVNADIRLTPAFKRVLEEYESDTLYFGSRTDVMLRDQGGEIAHRIRPYDTGLDVFLFPPSLLDSLDTWLPLPDAFRIGEPWWDYCPSIAALCRGVATKRLRAGLGMALHHEHVPPYTTALTTNNGATFLKWVAHASRHSGYPVAEMLGFAFDPQAIGIRDVNTAARVVWRNL
jgi:hypothetical protein